MIEVMVGVLQRRERRGDSVLGGLNAFSCVRVKTPTTFQVL